MVYYSPAGFANYDSIFRHAVEDILYIEGYYFRTYPDYDSDIFSFSFDYTDVGHYPTRIPEGFEIEHINKENHLIEYKADMPKRDHYFDYNMLVLLSNLSKWSTTEVEKTLLAE